MTGTVQNGLGQNNAGLRVYIGNRPDYADIACLSQTRCLRPGEVKAIGDACGNGWRKVFNVYAKLAFALRDGHLTPAIDCARWQVYRDQSLLQAQSNTALLFSPPVLNDNCVHLVMGKQYAGRLALPESLEWLDDWFAWAPLHNLIVCPYFDYRQLSDAKIIRLVSLLRQLPLVAHHASF